MIGLRKPPASRVLQEAFERTLWLETERPYLVHSIPATFLVLSLGERGYVVKDGKTGKIVFHEPDSNHGERVIQWAVDNLPSQGGKIVLGEGIFYISETIKPTKPLTIIEGMGTGDISEGAGLCTVIKLADGANCNGIENLDTEWRQLLLWHLVLDGNKANNTKGHGIVIDYLNMGGHEVGPGLFDVFIKDWAEDGIHGTQYPNIITAQAFRISDCGGVGLKAYVQGSQFLFPNWVVGNGGRGAEITGGSDCIIELYAEGNGEEGVVIGSLCNSIIRVWTKSNNGQGFYMAGGHGNLLIVHASRNGQNVTYPLYPAEVMFYDAHSVTAWIHTETLEQDKSGIHGVYIQTALDNSIIYGNIEATGYAIYIDGSPNLSNTQIQNCRLHGDLGVFNQDPVALGLVVRGNIGYPTDSFKSAGLSVEVGAGDYGSATEITSPSGVISHAKLKINIGGTFATDETVTVKVECVWESGNTTSIEKAYTATGSEWLSEDDWLSLWRDSDSLRKINVYAKSNQSSTSVTCSVDVIGAG